MKMMGGRVGEGGLDGGWDEGRGATMTDGDSDSIAAVR